MAETGCDREIAGQVLTSAARVTPHGNDKIGEDLAR